MGSIFNHSREERQIMGFVVQMEEFQGRYKKTLANPVGSGRVGLSLPEGARRKKLDWSRKKQKFG
jgi:hypothetical protein